MLGGEDHHLGADLRVEDPEEVPDPGRRDLRPGETPPPAPRGRAAACRRTPGMPLQAVPEADLAVEVLGELDQDRRQRP